MNLKTCLGVLLILVGVWVPFVGYKIIRIITVDTNAIMAWWNIPCIFTVIMLAFVLIGKGCKLLGEL